MVKAHGAGSVVWWDSFSSPSQDLEPHFHLCVQSEEHISSTFWNQESVQGTCELQSDTGFGVVQCRHTGSVNSCPSSSSGKIV